MSCFQYPLCHLPLVRKDKHYRCIGQHCFDCAKEGYVNLLPVQFKRSKDPGAAKRYAQVRFCVTSRQRLPFADESLDGVMRIYALSYGALCDRGVALLRITPFAWRSTPEMLERLAVATSFDLETNFLVRRWRRV